jgi:predicted MPP superfamily phosphohydrolase
LQLPKFPKKLQGLKVVQISDIHTGSVLSASTMERMVEEVMAQSPDLILFTGDLVNNTTAELQPFIPILSKLSAPLGVHSVLGNHDYGDYYRWPDAAARQANLEAMYDGHRQLGWNLLLNRHLPLFEAEGEAFYLAGVENWGAHLNFKRYGDLARTLQGIPESACILLMSHDPSHWEAEIIPDRRVALTLSGHTHGFQFGIEIPGFRWSPSQYVYKQWAGLYRQDEAQLYVNRGTGCIGYSGRVGIRPEITVLELHSA